MPQAIEKNIPLTIDNKGRVTIPKNVREALHIEQGDVLLLKFDTSDGNLRITRAIENPLEVLEKYADREFENGYTKNLRELLNNEK